MSLTSFVTLDIETANSKRESICQIGCCLYDESGLIGEWESLINPEQEFSPINIRIHKIDEDKVAHSPTFPEIFPSLINFIGDKIVISYSKFDLQCFQSASARYKLSYPIIKWLDASILVSKTIENKSHKLKDMAALLGIRYQHHHALADAQTCGHVFIYSMGKSNCDLISCFSDHGEVICVESICSGNMNNQIAVLDGYTIPFNVLQFLEANGATIAKRVTYSTTILIVDRLDQDTDNLNTAKRYNTKKGTIKIMTSREFIETYY